MIRRKNSSPCARSASTSSPIAERAQGDEFFRRIIRSEEHTSELQSHLNLVCRLLLEKKKKKHSNARIKRAAENGCIIPNRHFYADVPRIKSPRRPRSFVSLLSQAHFPSQ